MTIMVKASKIVCCFSCKLVTRGSPRKLVRVVHLNGYVEDFHHPVSVGQVTGTGKLNHIVCTGAELLSGGSKPLHPDTILETSRVYFLLPYSLLQSNVSPVDLAPLAKRLSLMAKKTSPRRPWSAGRSKGSASPLNNRRRFMMDESDMHRQPAEHLENLITLAATNRVMLRKPSKACSWRPILATIKERSFTRRSESDLHEMNLVATST